MDRTGALNERRNREQRTISAPGGNVYTRSRWLSASQEEAPHQKPALQAP